MADEFDPEAEGAKIAAAIRKFNRAKAAYDADTRNRRASDPDVLRRRLELAEERGNLLSDRLDHAMRCLTFLAGHIRELHRAAGTAPDDDPWNLNLPTNFDDDDDEEV